MKQERQGPHFGFLTINPEHFEIAKERTLRFAEGTLQNRELNRDLFSEGVLIIQMDEDPFLRQVVLADSKMLSALPYQMTRNFLYGSAVMYKVFEELNRIGYQFPHVSKGIAQTYLEEELQLLRGFNSRVKKPSEDLREEVNNALNAFEESLAESDASIMVWEDIYGENPVLRDFLNLYLISQNLVLGLSTH